jgi:hypothetical protein
LSVHGEADPECVVAESNDRPRRRLAFRRPIEQTSAEQKALERNPWVGRNRRYGIVKEGTIALALASLLDLGLSALLGSPDEPALTFQG